MKIATIKFLWIVTELLFSFLRRKTKLNHLDKQSNSIPFLALSGTLRKRQLVAIAKTDLRFARSIQLWEKYKIRNGISYGAEKIEKIPGVSLIGCRMATSFGA